MGGGRAFMSAETVTPAGGTGLGKERLLDLYRQMVLIRRCEEQLARAHQRGLVHGACHTYVGQEAVAAGVCAHLAREDVVFSTHRGHGHALAKGVPPRQLVAELFGRATGCSHGRGGTLLECRTYRTRPHAEGMGDFTYRSREEVEEWKTRCPIQRLRDALLADRTATEAELQAIDRDVQGLVEDAQRFAEESPWPD